MDRNAASRPAKSAAMPIERLRKRPQFLHVAKGEKAAMPGLILQARLRPDPDEVESAPEGIRIGYTATRKIGGAVVRNRTKRRLRAAAQTVLPEYGRKGFDYVLVGRTTTSVRAFDALCADLQKALVRIHQEPKAVNKTR